MERREERLILRVLCGEDVWMTADVTDTPFYVLEPWLCDMESYGCKVEITKVTFPCSGTPTVEDVAWLLASPSEEEDES